MITIEDKIEIEKIVKEAIQKEMSSISRKLSFAFGYEVKEKFADSGVLLDKEKIQDIRKQLKERHDKFKEKYGDIFHDVR